MKIITFLDLPDFLFAAAAARACLFAAFSSTGAVSTGAVWTGSAGKALGFCGMKVGCGAAMASRLGNLTAILTPQLGHLILCL